MEKGPLIPAARGVPSPHRKRSSFNLLVWLCLIGLASYQFTRLQPPPSSDSLYGSFPKAGDPLRLLPCTNLTTPPPMDDKDHEKSWAALFDADPAHWSWGNTKTSSSSRQQQQQDSSDAYAGRGIYLCGYLDVPLDYQNKSDTRIARLAITKFQVSGLARTDGSSPPGAGAKSERTLVLEPGGPGGSGVSMAFRSSERLTKRFTDGAFDTLGWDPRGVNASQPAISCFPYDADRDRWAMLTGLYREESADAETLLRWADSMNNATFEACWKRHGDLPRFMTTTLVARDLEQIRMALGEDQLSGYLVSYGTGIGQTYVNLYPESAGRIILDGTEYVRDHRELGGFGWTALDNATDAWHDGFLGECLHAGPAHCKLAESPDGGAEPVLLKDLDARMRALMASLITHPLPAYTTKSGPSVVTYRALVNAVYGSLYDANSWPAMARTLFELERGNTTLAARMLEMMAWEYDPTKPQPPSPRPRSDELGYMVICGDSYDAPAPVDGLAWWSSLWANMTAKSWVSGNSRFQNVFPCRHFTTYWPDVAEAYRGPLNASLANPVLLIAEAYDPATPLRNGRRLAAEMGHANARLVAHHGYGHSSRDTSSCTEAIARAYLVNGTVPEASETACYADQKPYLYSGVGVSVAAKEEAVPSGDPLEAWEEHVLMLRTVAPWLLG